MVRRIILTIARIMLGIPTLKVTCDDLRCFIPACYILKTKIIANEIYIRRLFTATGMYSSNWCDVEKNCLISRLWSRKVRRIVMWAT